MMNVEQKKLLESEILIQTHDFIEKNDLSVLPLIAFANQKDLFFPELYQMWYLSLVNIAVSKKQSLPLNSHEFFGLDLNLASQIYTDKINSAGPDLLTSVPEDNKEFISLKILQEHLKSGIFFNSDAKENNFLVNLLKPSKSFDRFEQINTTNYTAWLQSQLPEKNETHVRMQKI